MWGGGGGGGGAGFLLFSLRFLMQLEFLMIKISNAQTTSFNLKRKKRKKLLVQNAVTLKLYKIIKNWYVT